MHSISDEFLLDELKSGNVKAFDALFYKYYKFLVASAYFVLYDEQEAKDLVQDLLLEFWDKKIYLRLEGDIKGYLYRCIHNKSLNYLRKKTTEQTYSNEYLEETGLNQEEWTVSREEQLDALDLALRSLPHQRKEALIQVYIKEKKYQDAAENMGISLNSLKTHLKIGIRNLRNKFTDTSSKS